MPARSISRCETICASAGFSLRVGRKYLDRRMGAVVRIRPDDVYRARRSPLVNSLDDPLVVDEYPLRRRNARETGHGHDVTAQDDDEAGAGRQAHILDRQ